MAFAYLADPRNRPDWQSSLRAVADVVAVDGDATAVGTTWTDITVVPGVRPRMRTTESTCPLRWVEIGSFGPFRAELTLAFEPAPGGSTVTADFAVQGAGVGRFVTRGSGPAIAADLRRAAANLRPA
ncbi:MAG: SRPBCC family protein [Propionibacteriales bacterium]|nr:SRPBCC family protein [Propionibacteriales bacterium]